MSGRRWRIPAMPDAGIKQNPLRRMPVYSVELKLPRRANAQSVGIPDRENRKERKSE
jgi:hypothetical protein